jgi:hypothetical protein
MTDGPRRQSDRAALEACRQTRKEAADLLAEIGTGAHAEGRTASFLRTLVRRMDETIAGYEARGGA